MNLRITFLVFFGIVSTGLAKAQDYYLDFSFNADSRIAFSVQGTVTGTLTGVVFNNLFYPTDVSITSAPPAFGLKGPTDLGSLPNFAVYDQSHFLISNGVVIGGFLVSGTNSLELDLNGGTFLSNQLIEASPPVTELVNDNGFAGATYAVVYIPEPSTHLMLPVGLALLGFCVRRKLA